MNNNEHAQWQVNRAIVAAQHALDQGDYSAFANHFMEDGQLFRPTSTDPLVGRDAIRAAYEKNPTDRLSRHVISNVQVTLLDDTEANAISYVMLYSTTQTADDKPVFGWPVERVLLGEYHDHWIRKFDQWLLAKRHALFTMNLTAGDAL